MTSSEPGGFRPLETPRLKLVRTTLNHAEALFQIHGDLEAVRFLPRELCVDLAMCRDLVAKMMAVEERGQGYRWSISREGRVIGSVGFHAWSRERGEAQLSYELIPATRGKGYASEAVGVLLAFGFDEMRLKRVLAEAHGENHASLRLLRRAKFRRVGGYLRVWKGGGVARFERFTLHSREWAEVVVA